jgi:hypothetical protein
MSCKKISVMTAPRMPKTYQLRSLTDACQAHVEIRFDMGQELIHKYGNPLTIKEKEEAQKFREQKGTIPWNKG